MRDGVFLTAANVHPRWIGTDARALFARATRRRVAIINDADAAGYAEMTFGAGRGRAGLVILVTLGTGIGTALFINGHLVPNTELGHLELDGDAIRALNDEPRPDLIIVGGGVSRKAEKFFPRLSVAEKVEVVPARLLNDAGIVGAALAYEHASRRGRQRLALGPAARRRGRA